MDSNLKQIIEGFDYALKNYKLSLGDDNIKLKEAEGLLIDFSQKAEKSEDVMSLYMDASFSRLGKLIGELASETPLSSEELEKTGRHLQEEVIPSAGIAAAGYHIAFDNFPEAEKEQMRPYYEHIFKIENESENAIFFNAKLAEDGVLLRMSVEPLIAASREALEKSVEAYLPAVDYQHNLAIETYNKIKTVAEFEFEGIKMGELANIEIEWDSLYIEIMDRLVACARSIETFGTLDSLILDLKRSYKFMAEFMGISWDDIFADERYLFFWDNFIWNNYPDEKKKAKNNNTPKEYSDWLKKNCFEPFIRDEPLPVKNPIQKVHFWRRDIEIHHTMNHLKNPPRISIIKE